jgi:hypothetical protein
MARVYARERVRWTREKSERREHERAVCGGAQEIPRDIMRAADFLF